MRKLCVLGFALALASSAYAAPNVANATQKGSLLIFPDIRIDDNWNTLIRISNDEEANVALTCYWMDGNKHRNDFHIPAVTNFAPIWFDARTGQGSTQVNRFPDSPSSGLDNPYLVTPGFADEATDNAGLYREGLLACWATGPTNGILGGPESQIKWNHLSGTATVYNPLYGAYEYNAYSFFVAGGIQGTGVGPTPGQITMDGLLQYDQCPLYQIGQFSPANNPAIPVGALPVALNRLAISGCSLNLGADLIPVWTKLQFDLWNEEEVKFTGAFECADSWHETEFSQALTATSGGPIDAASQNFQYSTLQTYAARYRVQGVQSSQCANSVPVGVLAVQSTFLGAPYKGVAGSTLAAAGKFNGLIRWDPSGATPEGSIK